MTLVTAVVSQKWLALASDRRITFGPPGRPAWQEDATVKSVVHDGRYIIGFAGAVPAGEHVDMWIAGMLADRRGVAIDDYLRRALQERWQREPTLRGHAAAVVCVGFRQDGRPVGSIVSNALTPQGDVNALDVKDKFAKRGFTAPRVVQIGFPTDAEDRADLHRLAAANSTLNEGTYQRLVTDMAHIHRQVAEWSQGAVGKEFVLTTLPWAAIGKEVMVPLASAVLASVDSEISGVTVDDLGHLTGRFAPGISTSRAAGGGPIIAGVELRTRGPLREIGPRAPLGAVPPSQWLPPDADPV